jgi:hypothetical protein
MHAWQQSGKTGLRSARRDFAVFREHPGHKARVCSAFCAIRSQAKICSFKQLSGTAMNCHQVLVQGKKPSPGVVFKGLLGIFAYRCKIPLLVPAATNQNNFPRSPS